MSLTLLVPGLLWPHEILRDTTFDLPLPALSRLLGCAHLQPLTDAEDWLATAFGCTTPLPAAALRLLGAGSPPGENDWLCLDPVHLHLQEWAVIPDDPAALSLSAEEDTALRETIAPLFADLGELVATAPGRWHLRLTQSTTIATKPLPAAIGHAVDAMFPDGADSAQWRHRLAEAQPLLHAHKVNRLRAQAGRITVNHLWSWGTGRLPRQAQCAFTHVLTDDPVLRGLAVLADCAVTALPTRYADIAASKNTQTRRRAADGMNSTARRSRQSMRILGSPYIPAQGETLVQLDQLLAAPLMRDVSAWRTALAQLETDWFTPAVADMMRGRRLTLIFAGERACTASTTRASRWCFWRKPRNLADIAA
jgi:hypothetical protein